MKITKEQLKQIIKEELETIMSEYSAQGAEDEMEKKLQTELDRYESMRQALIKTGDVNMAGFGGHKDQVPSPKEALAILAKKIKEITDEFVTDSNSVKLEGLIDIDTTELETPTPEVVEEVINK